MTTPSLPQLDSAQIGAAQRGPDGATPAALADRVLEVAQRLLLVLDEETAKLQIARPIKFTDLVNEKSRLTSELAFLLKSLKAQPSGFAAIARDARKRLSAAMVVLDERVKVNGRAILRRKSISEGLARTIAAEAQKSSAPVATYAPPLASAPTGRKAASIICNRTI